MKKVTSTLIACAISIITFSQTLQEQLGTAIGSGNLEAVTMLVKQGADPNGKIPIKNTKYFESPLNSAVTVNKPEIVEELLKLGADPNKKNPQGATAIFATATGIVFGNKYWLEEIQDSVTADVKCASILIQNKANYSAKWLGKTWAQHAEAYKHDQLHEYALWIESKEGKTWLKSLGK